MESKENGVGKTANSTVLDIPQQTDGSAMDDFAKDLDNLSPTSKKNVQLLLRSLSRGQAVLDVDASGRQVIEYTQARKVWWDGSNANVINVPKTDTEVLEKVDACLELVDFLKTERSPSGVVLDKTKISLSPGRQYREGREFTKTKNVLGKGNSAGDIVVVKDMKTGSEHAQKTMMISVFRKEEIQCWVDMSDTGYVPQLYLFQLEGNRISVHMEPLKNAITLRSVIDDHMERFYKSEEGRPLVKPFSLFVLDGALEAVSSMHQKGWAHRDLHAGNVMVQKSSQNSLDVKIIDFGMAKQIEHPDGLDFLSFRADISEVLRVFSGLYSGLEFDNVWDIQHNWKERINNETFLSETDKKDLLCLMDAAMKIVHPDDVEEYRNLVKDKLLQVMDDKEEEVLRAAAAILFEGQLQSKITEPMSTVKHAVICDEIDVADAAGMGDHVDEKLDHGKDSSEDLVNEIRLVMSIRP